MGTLAATSTLGGMMKQPTRGDLVQRFAVDADLSVRVNADYTAGRKAAVVDFKELRHGNLAFERAARSALPKQEFQKSGRNFNRFERFFPNEPPRGQLSPFLR